MKKFQSIFNIIGVILIFLLLFTLSFQPQTKHIRDFDLTLDFPRFVTDIKSESVPGGKGLTFIVFDVAKDTIVDEILKDFEKVNNTQYQNEELEINVSSLKLNSLFSKVLFTFNELEVKKEEDKPLVKLDMIFDTHSDILFDILKNQVLGKKDVIETHLNDRQIGNIKGGLWALYYPSTFNYDIEKATNQIIDTLSNYEIDMTNILFGFEGMRFVKDLDQLERLYNKGFKFASLTWNEGNQWGTGVSGSSNRGLTNKGKEMISKMEELGMLVDVSHANEKTFWDIANMATKPIIASHSNAYSLCKDKRNLKDDQLIKIKELNGVVGINAVSQYISKDKNKQDIDGMIDHIDYVKNLIGIDYISLGFDYLYYLGDESNIKDLNNESKSYAIVTGLQERGYSSEEIEKILYKNIQRVINDVITK